MLKNSLLTRIKYLFPQGSPSFNADALQCRYSLALFSYF